MIGGGGFIGTTLVRQLLQSGRAVVSVGRSPRPTQSLPKGTVYRACDYSDRKQLRDVLAGVTEVVDLAYATAPQTSFADPLFDLVANVPPAVTLLQEALALGVQKVVLVSSGGTVYGIPDYLPISEDHATRPISPYGITKLAIENYGLMFHSLFDLPVVVVRPSNAYGEGQRMLSGQGFIVAAVERVLDGQEVEVYGERGTIRDYIHVNDVSSGIVAALDKGEAGKAYNIGTGIGRTNFDVLKIIEPLAAKAGLSVRYRALPPRKFDVPANYLDSSRLRSISGWQASVSLERGIEALWQSLWRGRKIS